MKRTSPASSAEGKNEWRCTCTSAHVFLACTERALCFTLLRRIRNKLETLLWVPIASLHIECGMKTHRWSVAESLLGSVCPQLCCYCVWRLALNTQVLKTFRVVCGSLKMCVLSDRLAPGLYLESDEWWFPLPQLKWDVYLVEPSATVFATVYHFIVG
jgi:hypothetical protein